MGKIVLIDEDDLRRIFREVLDERKTFIGNLIENTTPADNFLCTSLYDIAQVLHCSLPKAQHVKNSIPKSQYFQHGRKFAISKIVLLNSHKDMYKSK
ncbi:MAG: hypothetical protein WCQ95_00330 [Bacteroidota bacterium]